MVKLEWTKEAKIWLNDIFDYIAQENRDAARKVIHGIHAKVRLLKTYPEIGHQYRADLDGDIRILLYGHYRIAYFHSKADIVTILGIFHGALDIERYLR